MMDSYIHNENDIALEGFRRCQNDFHFLRIIAEYKAKLQHMQIHL
jgi:hypothetical protein